MSRTRLFCTLLGMALVAPVYAQQFDRPTNFGDGADAEVRESNPTQNRGDGTELATRVIDRFTPATFDFADRRSVMFLQFDLLGTGGATGADLRLTYRNNNLSISRISDQDNEAPDLGAQSLAVYGIPGASFDEGVINYLNAPGMTPDGEVGTNDLDAGNLLGTVDFPDIGTQNHLPIGGALVFDDPALDAFIAGEIANGSEVAVLAVTANMSGILKDTGDPNQEKFGDEPTNWGNFNYLFNPKEQTTLNTDNYDPDGNGSIGNAFGTDNSTGAFSPTLIFQGVPEPSSALLGALAVGFAALRRRV